jgi:single-strand DNA-binding protein
MNLLAATGRLGQDAKLSYTANQDAICNFSLSLTAGYGDKATTTWLNCNLWGKRAEILAPMLLKGTQIGVTGEISLRPYKGKDGTEKSSLECRVNDVTLLGGKSENKTENKPAKFVDPSNDPMDGLESDIIPF